MASFKLKQPYQALQKVEDKADFRQMRAAWDEVRIQVSQYFYHTQQIEVCQ